MTNRNKQFIGIGLCVVILAAGFIVPRFMKRSAQNSVSQTASDQTLPSGSAQPASSTFGESVKYQTPTTKINPEIAKDFSISSITNISDMENAYGFKFTDAEKKSLTDRKFVMKNVLDTSIRPNSSADNGHEMTQMYAQVQGPRDYKNRAPQNTLFYSSDVFLDSFNNIYTETLKEMENKTFSPAMLSLSKTFYEQANKKLLAAKTDADKKEWMKVRNYFVVPYAIFSNAAQPLTLADYQDASGVMLDPNKVMSDWKAKDVTVDTVETVSAFVKNLKLDTESETVVLTDVKTIFSAEGKAVPQVFADEYKAYTQQEGIDFEVDFSQFTPRATYTSSSLRREYFRGMKWYIMLPFFLKSPDLTTYAYGISQLMAENKSALSDYNKLEAAINFLVGTSDDLAPADYLAALQSAKGSSNQTETAFTYLVKAHDPKIKDLGAGYASVGTEQTDDVRLKTKGMRFFSGKFIVDSYWTGYLTQGDEALRPGYTQKLPPMASSLEVMTLLGSEYAESQIPKLDFYSVNNKLAIEKALGELGTQTDAYTQSDWQKNVYTTWMWTIQSLFGWQKTNHDVLPQFMQSVAWQAKTLQTASAWWTQLRHATILYAKQSFAEKGGGGPGCDTREVPPPPKAYIEPQQEAFARLSYLAKRMDQGLKDQGYADLKNIVPLENFIALMDTVQSYVEKELGNSTLNEKVVTVTGVDPEDETKPCVHHDIEGTSDWEALRVGLMDGLTSALPVPTEGPILSAKDKREAIIADVHTGGDSSYPTSILYEGTGVPYVIFIAVNDVNDPRLTVGFTYSQYEFIKEYGGKRLTDEDWQKSFYEGDDTYDAYHYTDKSALPKINVWYQTLFDSKK